MGLTHMLPRFDGLQIEINELQYTRIFEWTSWITKSTLGSCCCLHISKPFLVPCFFFQIIRNMGALYIYRYKRLDWVSPFDEDESTRYNKPSGVGILTWKRPTCQFLSSTRPFERCSCLVPADMVYGYFRVLADARRLEGSENLSLLVTPMERSCCCK